MKILKDILLIITITFAVVSAILIMQSCIGIDNSLNLVFTLPIVLISGVMYWTVDYIEKKMHRKGGDK